ncbi:MAG: hemolysin family protein [Firmicutes bacterium]|nr:hemolysin family protein [Bacillota bacterium]
MEISHTWSLLLSVQFNPVFLILIIVLLIVSAFFSMTEMAYSAVGKVRLKNLVEQKIRGSKKAFWIIENFDKALTTLLVGNNLANIGLASVSVLLFTGFFSALPNADTIITLLNTLVMTTLILIFGEILPKSLAKTHPDKICLGVSSILYFLIKVMTPMTFLFRILNNKVVGKINSESKLTVTESELETIIDTMEEEGSIDEEEADMLQKVLDLSEITVESIMTPRVDMVAIEVTDDLQKVTEVFFKSKFSRIPVYDDNKDNIIGVLSERDYYTKLIKRQNINLKKMLRKPIFIPATTKVDALIELLQQENSHLAIVVDEYGGVDGLVTMEDALEELVGEIYDEHDDVTENIIKKGDSSYVINADYDLTDLFEDLDLGDAPVSESTSVGGWLFEKFQDIPEVGEKIEYEIKIHQVYDDLSELISEDIEILTFEVLQVHKRRIKSVLLTVDVHNENLEVENS